MDPLTLSQAILLLVISVMATLLAVGVVSWFVGFEKEFNAGEFYEDGNNSNLFRSIHLPYLTCKLVPHPRMRPDLMMFEASLPFCLNGEDMKKLMIYVPQLRAYIFLQNYPFSSRMIVLQKSQDIYWGDILHKILQFFFCKMYKEYHAKIEESPDSL